MKLLKLNALQCANMCPVPGTWHIFMHLCTSKQRSFCSCNVNNMLKLSRSSLVPHHITIIFYHMSTAVTRSMGGLPGGIGEVGCRISCEIASSMSQLILQSFHRFTYITAHSTTLPCFTYVIGTSPTSQHILKPFRRFIYSTARSTTLPPLHLRHRSFYNLSVASPTSQALHVLHLASRPCNGGMKNSVCGGIACYRKLLSLEVDTVLDS